MADFTKDEEVSLKVIKKLKEVYEVFSNDKSNEAMKRIPFGAFVSDANQKALASIPKFTQQWLMMGGLVGIYKTLGTGLTIGERISTVLTTAKDGATLAGLAGGYSAYVKGFYVYLTEKEVCVENLHKVVRRRSLKRQNTIENSPLTSIHSLGFPDAPSSYDSQYGVDPSPYPYL